MANPLRTNLSQELVPATDFHASLLQWQQENGNPCSQKQMPGSHLSTYFSRLQLL